MSRSTRDDASSRLMRRVQPERQPERDRLGPRCTPSLPDAHGIGCSREGSVVAWRAPREPITPAAVDRLFREVIAEHPVVNAYLAAAERAEGPRYRLAGQDDIPF